MSRETNGAEPMHVIYRRDDERHDNALVDTTLIPAWLADLGLEDVVVGTSFGGEQLPPGLMTVVATMHDPGARDA